MIAAEESAVRTNDGDIATTLYRSASMGMGMGMGLGMGGSVLILAPGAGASRAHPFMTTVAAAIAEAGVHVRTFDFAYMTAGKKAPDRMPKLVATYRAVLDDTRARFGGSVVVGGKSMGSRVACEIACVAHEAAMSDVLAVVSLGYPLAPKGREKERVPREALLARTPLAHLVVQGSRDAFGGELVMREVVAKVPLARLAIVPHADHAFEMAKRDRGGRSPDDVWRDVGTLVATFVGELATGV